MTKENRIQKQADPEELKRAEEYVKELKQANGHADWRVVVDMGGKVMIEKEKPDGEIVLMPVDKTGENE